MSITDKATAEMNSEKKLAMFDTSPSLQTPEDVLRQCWGQSDLKCAKKCKQIREINFLRQFDETTHCLPQRLKSMFF